MQKYKAIIFDVDGTILDPAEGMKAAIEYTVNVAGLKALTTKQLDECVGPPIQNSLKRFYGFDDNKAQEIANIFRNRYKDADLLKANLYEGILELFKMLKQQNYKVGIATYKRQDYAEKLLVHFGFDKYCDSICGADNENKLKKIDIMKNCQNELNIDINNSIMIGDSLHDAIASEELKMDFIAVTYGFGFKNKEDANQYKNIFVAHNVDDLLKIFSTENELLQYS